MLERCKNKGFTLCTLKNTYKIAIKVHMNAKLRNIRSDLLRASVENAT